MAILLQFTQRTSQGIIGGLRHNNINTCLFEGTMDNLQMGRDSIFKLGQMHKQYQHFGAIQPGRRKEIHP